MKNILLIDDLRNFRKVNPLDMLVIARTSEEGLAALRGDKNGWDEIWLDHDLGLKDDGTTDTIMPIVDYLCERSFNNNPVPVDSILVHTSNPVGRGNIIRALNRYGYNCFSVAPEPVFVVE